jgi:hypothetical protein
MYICSLPIIALIMAAVWRGHRPLEVMYKAADVPKKAAQQEASIRPGEADPCPSRRGRSGAIAIASRTERNAC